MVLERKKSDLYLIPKESISSGNQFIADEA